MFFKVLGITHGILARGQNRAAIRHGLVDLPPEVGRDLALTRATQAEIDAAMAAQRVLDDDADREAAKGKRSGKAKRPADDSVGAPPTMIDPSQTGRGAEAASQDDATAAR